MEGKICLIIISLAGLAFELLSPFRAAAVDMSVFDQFADAFGSGLFQGVLINSELNLESNYSSGNLQGINIISGNYNVNAVQVAAVTSDVFLSLSGGENTVQALNIYQGSADGITQIAVIDGSVTMTSSNNNGGIQGINVITESCDSCN
jgi:hypothetical protein